MLNQLHASGALKSWQTFKAYQKVRKNCEQKSKKEEHQLGGGKFRHIDASLKEQQSNNKKCWGRQEEFWHDKNWRIR